MNASAIQALVSYNDMANRMILQAAAGLSAEQLDQPFEMGVGTLRKTLVHIWAGEHMWLQRWLGCGDTPWVAENEAISVADLEQRWQKTISDRDAFLSSVPDEALARMMTYRDSRGPRYTAALEQMILQ
ncbi:MAG: DinB family protein, partial [Phycisphaerales bacterium JB039]